MNYQVLLSFEKITKSILECHLQQFVQYWLVTGNYRLEDYAYRVIVLLGKLTVLDMTPLA